MVVPDRETFLAEARPGRLIPVYGEILADMETPVSAFYKLRDNSDCFLLESVEGEDDVGRYSFLGRRPRSVLTVRGAEATVEGRHEKQTLELTPERDMLHVLADLLGDRHFCPTEGLPAFCGGAVGYIGYECVEFFEELPNTRTDDVGLPDAVLMLTDTLLVFDHRRHRLKVLVNVPVSEHPEQDYERAIAEIEGLIEELRSTPAPPMAGASSDQDGLHIESNLQRQEFESIVERAKEYVAAGDIIQVVLSQRLSAPFDGDPFGVYRALRSINPSPYMFYLDFGDVQLVGASPEILVTEEEGLVTARPLAGTRPRGATAEQDSALAVELLADEKERAEHVMLVDLGRNDIGRVCRRGTVQVTELMNIERYSHVMHIYSHVVGRLREDRTAFDALRACFPAGTVSGAPKIRAMEIIDELEPTRRGPYAGAIGYFSYAGSMETAITIRTLVFTHGRAYVQAGAGIVADSVPAREYEETMNKARALLSAVEMAQRGLDG